MGGPEVAWERVCVFDVSSSCGWSRPMPPVCPRQRKTRREGLQGRVLTPSLHERALTPSLPRRPLG